MAVADDIGIGLEQELGGYIAAVVVVVAASTLPVDSVAVLDVLASYFEVGGQHRTQ